MSVYTETIKSACPAVSLSFCFGGIHLESNFSNIIYLQVSRLIDWLDRVERHIGNISAMFLEDLVFKWSLLDEVPLTGKEMCSYIQNSHTCITLYCDFYLKDIDWSVIWYAFNLKYWHSPQRNLLLLSLFRHFVE